MPGKVRPGQVSDECSEAGALLDLVTSRPGWHAEAACRGHPEITWFPAKGEDSMPAKAICSGCPVLADCLAWALAQPPLLAGVWGGTTQRERLGGVLPHSRPRPEKPAP